MERRHLGIALLVMSLLAGTRIQGQQRVAFEELGRVLEPGQAVVVKDNDGRVLQGKVVSISDQSIVIAKSRFWRRQEERTFQVLEIARIARADSRWNGALLGMAVGVGTAGVIAARGSSNPDVGAPGAFLTYGVLLGVSGAGIGAIIDNAFRRTIYESSPRSPTARIIPVLHQGRGRPDAD